MLHFGIPVYIFAISFLKRMSPSHRIDACECSRTACRPIILPIRIRIRVRLFLGTWLNHLLRKPYPQKFSKFYSLWLFRVELDSHSQKAFKFYSPRPILIGIRLGTRLGTGLGSGFGIGTGTVIGIGIGIRSGSGIGIGIGIRIGKKPTCYIFILLILDLVGEDHGAWRLFVRH